MYSIKALPEFSSWLDGLKDGVTRIRLALVLRATRPDLDRDVGWWCQVNTDCRHYQGDQTCNHDRGVMMVKKIKVADLPEFDLAEQLKTEEDIAAYLTMVIDEGDMAELAHALGVAARARGMSDVAKASGITREALYKALRPDASPRFDTISRVCAALGVRLVAQPVGSQL
jgi:probable addiction module antidote protein